MLGSLPWFSDLTLGKLTGAGATTRPKLTMPFLLVADAMLNECQTALCRMNSRCVSTSSGCQGPSAEPCLPC